MERGRKVSDAEGSDRRASQDELIVAALAIGRSYEEAADAAGVSARTVRRRMADDGFAGEVRALRAERASRLSAGLLGLGDEALEVLSEVLREAEPGIRLRAAHTALTFGHRYLREVEMADRIAVLERRLDIALGGQTADSKGDDDEIA